jgi:hypothetical protein
MIDRPDESRKRVLESLIQINSEIEDIYNDVIRRTREYETRIMLEPGEEEIIEMEEQRDELRSLLSSETEGTIQGHFRENEVSSGQAETQAWPSAVNSRNTSEVQRLQLNNTRVIQSNQGMMSGISQRPDIYNALPIVNENYPWYAEQERFENQRTLASSWEDRPNISRRTRRDAVDYTEMELNYLMDSTGHPEPELPELPDSVFQFVPGGSGNPEVDSVRTLSVEPNMEDVKVPTDLKTLVEKTKVKLYENPNYNCAICQDSYIKNDIVRQINFCNHLFHIDCIDKWFSDNHTCPECRFDIRS